METKYREPTIINTVIDKDNPIIFNYQGKTIYSVVPLYLFSSNYENNNLEIDLALRDKASGCGQIRMSFEGLRLKDIKDADTLKELVIKKLNSKLIEELEKAFLFEEDMIKQLKEITKNNNKKSNILDKTKKEEGYKYKMTFVVHRDGEDQVFKRYFKRKPSQSQINKILKETKSVQDDDYTIVSI